MDYSIQTKPWTFDWTLDQLERAHDYLDRENQLLSIVYVLYEDSSDHYIALIDCDERTAVYLTLIV